jgi:hypothetical protein
MTLANFQIDGKSPVSQMSFMRSKRVGSADSGSKRVGSDDIHYQLLKHLPESALPTLLDLMNDIWETGDLPSIWKLANVIPIPKPSKDHSEPK